MKGKTASRKVIGIDLGTTNSCVAVYEDGRARVLRNPMGTSTTPSVVHVDASGKFQVGVDAQRRASTDPKATVAAIKRIMGRRHDSPECLQYAETSPLRMKVSPDGFARIDIHGKLLSPEEVTALILDHMREQAERNLGHGAQRAVVTVPAYFDDAQRHATRNAGCIAGLDVLRILNEPTAAALAYGLGKERDGLVAIYDLGGGTFDMTLLEIDSGVFQVKATKGDSYLGGLDFDWRIGQWAMEKYESIYGEPLQADESGMQRLLEACEETKKALSIAKHAPLAVPNICVGDDGKPRHLDLLLGREVFEGLTQPIVEKTLECCRHCLDDAGMQPSDVDWVIFVGGQTRTPLVAKEVERFIGKKPLKGINPDEVVAMGAAVMGGLLAGEIHDVVLIDVTPHTVGLAIKGGAVHPLIPRNTPVPAEAKHSFPVPPGRSGTIKLKIVQGESEIASENEPIGTVALRDLPPSEDLRPRIEVTFHVDHNGILNVSVLDRLTGKLTKEALVDAARLSGEDLSRMSHDMVTYRQTQHERMLLAEEKNRAAALLSEVKKLLGSEREDGLWKDLLKEARGELEEILARDHAASHRAVKEKIDKLSAQVRGVE